MNLVCVVALVISMCGICDLAGSIVRGSSGGVVERTRDHIINSAILEWPTV